jgi:hypothetical protein
VTYLYILSNSEAEDLYIKFEKELEKVVSDFNKASSYIEIFVQTESGISNAFSETIQDDLAALQLAIVLIGVYSVLVLGSIHPRKCRA